MSTADLRKDYVAGKLHRSDLAANPFAQFGAWFDQALACTDIGEANAMTLATCGADGRVTARTVLLKDWSNAGFTFFSNYESLKARQIDENPQVSLLFSWLPLERQIAIAGRAEKTSREESDAYFSSRPEQSRVGAWASPQSQPVASRGILEKKFEAVQKKFPDGNIPLPDFWGGYRVIPATMEFWQGRPNRLHDRFLYTRGAGDSWSIERLSP